MEMNEKVNGFLFLRGLQVKELRW